MAGGGSNLESYPTWSYKKWNMPYVFADGHYSPRESVGFLKDSSLYFAISFAKTWMYVPGNLARTGLHVSATQITVSLATA